MSVKDYMRKAVSTIDEEATVSEASKAMLADGVGYLVVLDVGRPIGLVTERDLVNKVLAKDLEPSRVRVKEIMSSPPVTVDPDASIEEAVETMMKKSVRRLPVVKNGIIYGIFTARDLIDHFDEFEDRIERNIIRSAFFLSPRG
jgi:CBS domain-containing protein